MADKKSTRELILLLSTALFAAGATMVGDLVGVGMVGVSLFVLSWIYVPSVVKENSADDSRTQAWLWSVWIVIAVVCFFWGRAVYLHGQVPTYTIKKEDEMEFVQAWWALERPSNVEIAYANGDTKAAALAERMSSLFILSKWEVQEWNITGKAKYVHIPSGVTIWAIDHENGGFPASAILLRALLKKYNIKSWLHELPPGEGVRDMYGSLRIFVGPEP